MKAADVVLSCLAWLLAAVPQPGETQRVIARSDDGQAMRECVKAVEEAVNEEDLEAYVECFVDRVRNPLRHRIGMLFVKHEMAMEILDSHVLGKSEKGGEIAVKYRAVLSGRTSEVVAVLGMTKEDGRWRISKENIHSTLVVRPEKIVTCGSACGIRPFHLGGGQACGALPPNCNQYDPPADLIDPALEHLRGDIGILPGKGCSSGRCGPSSAWCR